MVLTVLETVYFCLEIAMTHFGDYFIPTFPGIEGTDAVGTFTPSGYFVVVIVLTKVAVLKQYFL